MEQHAFWALQRAVYQRLSMDAGVLSALGGARIYDDVPRTVTFPYVTLGAAQSADWSTGESDGDAHTLILNAWSRAGGRREVLQISEVVRAALQDADLTLVDHRLVMVTLVSVDTRRGADGETYQATMRFRVLTERSA